tara:strand:- start:1040 stop:1417 length:378 start_codon:yes stop_codon:yes gene_type:complete
MIKGFEKYTHELTDVELHKVLPIVIKGLSNKIGKHSAVSNKFICDTLNAKQMFGKYKLTSPRIRKIINHIRMTGVLLHLCSCQKGYFVAKTKDEFFEYLDGLGQRIDSQQQVHDALIFQLKNFSQ